VGRIYAVGFSIGNKGYIGAGSSGGCLNDFWEYDTTVNAWNPKANFQGGLRYYAVGFSIGARGYVGTGDNCSSVINDFWEYDPNTDLWTQQSAPTSPSRFGAVGFSIGNQGYIGLGYGQAQFTYYNDFWQFSPSTSINEISILHSPSYVFPNPMINAASVVVSKSVDCSNASLRVFTIDGKDVTNYFKSDRNSSAKHFLFKMTLCGSLPDGIYYYQIRDSKQVISTGNFIKGNN
jgi:hypothetical protein